MRSPSAGSPSWSRVAGRRPRGSGRRRDRAPRHASSAAERRLIPLERVEQVSVLVDDMTPDAETLSLTRELIQADAEAQLLSNGLRVRGEGVDAGALLPGLGAVRRPRPVRHRRVVGGGPGRLPRGDGDVVDPRQDLVHRPDHPGAAIRGERERAQRRARPGRRVRRRRPGGAPARPRRRPDERAAAPARTSRDFGPRRGN